MLCYIDFSAELNADFEWLGTMFCKLWSCLSKHDVSDLAKHWPCCGCDPSCAVSSAPCHDVSSWSRFSFPFCIWATYLCLWLQFCPFSSHLPSHLFGSCCFHLHLIWVGFFLQHVCFPCCHHLREHRFIYVLFRWGLLLVSPSLFEPYPFLARSIITDQSHWSDCLFWWSQLYFSMQMVTSLARMEWHTGGWGSPMESCDQISAGGTAEGHAMGMGLKLVEWNGTVMKPIQSIFS